MGKLWGGAAFHDVQHLSEKAAARGLLELEAIWEMKRDRLIVRERGGKVARTTEMGSGVLFDTVFWAPDLVFVGAHAAGHTVAAAAEAAPTAPQFTDGPGRLKRFDFAVANPPFSDKAWTNGLNPAHDEYRRFDHGEPPAKNGDYAYLLHLVASLRSTGKGAIVMPHGVLFRGNREAAIRRNLVKRGWIKGVIGLPANLFYGTGIPACIVVIDKENALGRDGIFMIDASKG